MANQELEEDISPRAEGGEASEEEWAGLGAKHMRPSTLSLWLPSIDGDQAEVQPVPSEDVPSEAPAKSEPGPDDESFEQPGDSAGNVPMADGEQPSKDDEGPSVASAPTEQEHVQTPSDVEGPTEPTTPERLGRRRIRPWVIVALVAIVCAYGVGVYRSWGRFLPNTHVGRCDVSNMTLDETVAALRQETSSYACEVVVDDFSMNLYAQDIALVRDEESIAADAFAHQNPFLWPTTALFGSRLAAQRPVTFDEQATRAVVSYAVHAYNEQVLPRDKASIRFDEDKGVYSLEGSVEGSALDADAMSDAVEQSVRLFDDACSPDSEAMHHPATVEDLTSFADAVTHANAVRTADLDVLVDGKVVATSEAEDHADWVSIDESPSVQVDKDAVRAWAEGSVAAAAYHRDEWYDYVLNEDAFVAEFCQRLADGNTDAYEVPTTQELRDEGASREFAYKHGGWESERGRYLDVDLEAQFARLFDERGDVLWESAFVSGDMLRGRQTITGTFEIYSKQTNTILAGADYSSFVSYWMPFCGGFGLHDATWRSSFGGEEYETNGSHGCVNLPLEKAEELYDLTFVGETVYVHW